MIITKCFEFDAAHNLVNYRGKCEKLHGHTYRLEVSLKGKPDNEGMIEDFKEIEKIVKEKVLSILDHSYINDVIKQPTAENIALWAWNQLKNSFKKANLYEIRLFESEDSWVSYRGEHKEHD